MLCNQKYYYQFVVILSLQIPRSYMPFYFYLLIVSKGFIMD